MIIIGNKRYENLKLDNLIDYFNKNLRLNMSLPNNNNGTKYDEILLNCHVYDNIKKKNETVVKIYKKLNISDDIIIKFYKNINLYNNIKKQRYKSISKPNQILSDLKCKNKLIKQPRIGMEGILNNIKKNPYIICFSIKPNIFEKHLYVNSLNSDKINYNKSKCHDWNSEIEVLKCLHINKYIDATFCLLEDTEIPTLDATLLEPTVFSINILIEIYNKCIIKKEDNHVEINEKISDIKDIKL